MAEPCEGALYAEFLRGYDQGAEDGDEQGVKRERKRCLVLIGKRMFEGKKLRQDIWLVLNELFREIENADRS